MGAGAADLSKSGGNAVAAAFPDKSYSTWADVIEGECEVCERSGRNYVSAYDSICAVLSHDLQARLREVSGVFLEANPKPLALPDRDSVVAAMPKSELQAFCEAVDPFTLNELYERPIKRAKRLKQEVQERAKRELTQAEFFWFDTFEKQRRDKLHLRLERPHREALLNSLQVMVRELRESLKNR